MEEKIVFEVKEIKKYTITLRVDSYTRSEVVAGENLAEAMMNCRFIKDILEVNSSVVEFIKSRPTDAFYTSNKSFSLTCTLYSNND